MCFLASEKEQILSGRGDGGLLEDGRGTSTCRGRQIRRGLQGSNMMEAPRRASLL